MKNYQNMNYSISLLDNTNITEEEYKFAQEAWNVFNCKTLDYLNKYYMIDILLLADSFQSFRNHCLLNYQLDSAYCVSLPRFTFEAFLWKITIELELLHNVDIYQFFELSIKGDITSLVQRYSKANTCNLKHMI